jgi:hypothetical protein
MLLNCKIKYYNYKLLKHTMHKFETIGLQGKRVNCFFFEAGGLIKRVCINYDFHYFDMLMYLTRVL